MLSSERLAKIQAQGLIICSHKCGLARQKQLNERKSSNGLSINRSSRMRGSWDASTLSIHTMESSRKQLKQRTEAVGDQASQQAKPKESNKIQKTKHACIVEAHESTRKRWYHLYRKIKKITWRRKRSKHSATLILCTNLFPCLKRWKFRMQRQHWIRRGKSSKNARVAIDLTKMGGHPGS